MSNIVNIRHLLGQVVIYPGATNAIYSVLVCLLDAGGDIVGRSRLLTQLFVDRASTLFSHDLFDPLQGGIVPV